MKRDIYFSNQVKGKLGKILILSSLTFQMEPYLWTFQNKLENQQYGMERVLNVTKYSEALPLRKQWKFIELKKVMEIYIGLFEVGECFTQTIVKCIKKWLFFF